MQRKSLIRFVYTFLFITILSLSYVIAQEPPEGDEGGDPDAVPLDGGISLLLAAGAAYGVKKIRDYRQDKA